jgi:tetratricopeptide (TPR) repeat protein
MIAAAAFSLLFMQAGPAPVAASAAPDRYARCVAAAEADAQAAYESAMAWANETQDISAFRCAAVALIEQGRAEQGARRLESLASAAEGHDAGTRAALLSQAGHAWLLARDPTHARSAFTRAIAAVGNDREALPDLLIDRSIAYSGEGDNRHAEEDLSRSLDLRPDNPLALRLRALTRMRQNAFDLARADAEAALAINPRDVDSALVLGHVRESQRLGRPIAEDGAAE